MERLYINSVIRYSAFVSVVTNKITKTNMLVTTKRNKKASPKMERLLTLYFQLN